MDTKEVVQTNGNEVMKHIFRYDDETKSVLTNLVQYTMLAIIPIACLQKASDKLFSDYDESNGTAAILAEILGQSVLTIIGLFMIHRIITAVPTFSGNAMEDIHLFSIVVAFLVASFMFEGKMQRKINAVMNRIFDSWDEAPKQTQKNNDGGKVRVSQPISNNGMPTHQASRADYIGTHANLTEPQPPVQQTPSIADKQNIYAQEAPPMLQEPMAANAGFGAFSAF
jgi:hypothetical protein